MTRKRLNKNVVAGLTMGGIALCVVVVAIGAVTASHRDPEVLAKKALQREEAKDYRRAIDFYKRAFRVRNEAKYLVEAARVAYRSGEIRDTFNLLHQAYSQSPEDTSVLNALLERYWEFRDYDFSQWPQVLDYSDALLGVQPDHLLALVSKAEALEKLRDRNPQYSAQAAVVLERAAQLGPTDPRVALIRAWRFLMDGREAARTLQQSPERREEAERTLREHRARAADVLRPALEQSPEDTDVRTLLAQCELDDGRPETAQQLLEQGVAQKPDDADARFSLAKFFVLRALKLRAEGATEPLTAVMRAGLESLSKTLELEPALYDAYGLLAELQRTQWELEGRWATDTPALQKQILEIYTQGLDKTKQLQSIRAVLGSEKRAAMIVRAFDTAVDHYREAADELTRKQAMQYARQFLAEAQARYREYFIVPLMEGRLAVIDGDLVSATKAFERAAGKLAGSLSPFNTMAQEQLARLYLQQGEVGLSLKYTEQAIQSYVARGQPPPLWLWVNKTSLLNNLERPQQALDILDAIDKSYPNEPELLRIRARTLAMLNRTTEARALLDQMAATDTRAQLDKARIAARDKDYDGAEAILRALLEREPQNLAAVRMLVAVMAQAERQEQAAAFLNELSGKLSDPASSQQPDPAVLRTLKALQVTVSAKDAAERNEQLRRLIEEIPDPAERAGELFSYWVARGDFVKADQALEQLEQARGPEENVLRARFETALELKQFDRAERYLTQLAQRNVDRAGGALLRGQFALAKREAEKALAELRAAERELATDSQVKVWIAHALLSLPQQRVEEAIDVLKQAIEFDPRNFEALKLVYICFSTLGRESEGIEHLKAAARINPRDAFIREKSRLLEEEEDPRKGIAWREQRREKNPDDVDNLLRLTELYQRVDDGALAEQRLQEALAADAANPKVAQAAALFYANRKDRPGGEAALQRTIEAAAAVSPAEGVRAKLLLGRFYDRLGEHEAAYAVLAQAEREADALQVDAELKQRARIVAAADVAEHFMRAEKYAEAVPVYNRILGYLQSGKGEETAVVRQEVMVKLLRALLSLRQFAEFEQKVHLYRKDYPNELRGKKLEAEYLLRTNQLEPAREMLARVLEQNPDDAWALFMRGRFYIDLRRYNEARADLLRLKQIDAKAFNYQPRLQLARLYQLTEQIPLAEAELRELVAENPDDRTHALRLIALYRANKQLQKAQDFVNEMSARHPEEPFWPYQFGRLLVEREEYSAAIAPLERAVDKTKGQSPVILADYLVALTRGNRARDAVRVFRNLEEKLVTPVIRAYAAEALLAIERRDEAREQFSKALLAGAQESSQAVNFVAGRAITLLGRAEALELLRAALTQATEAQVPALRSVLSRVLAQDEGPEPMAEAMRLVEQTLAATPPDSPYHLEALLVQARVLEVRKDYEGAVKLYEQVIERNPNLPHALNNLAYLLADVLNRPQDAVPYAEKAYTLMSEDANVLDTVGWVYYRVDRLGEAESMLLEALRFDPDNLAARYHLGLLLAKAQRTAEARRTLEKGREVARQKQNNEYLQKIEQELAQLP